MTIKRILCAQRLRRIPAQFSWVDPRLVFDGHLGRCDAHAAALYLLLTTVADAQGLSYWGDMRVTQLLHTTRARLGTAREDLMALGLLAYERPLYQVLSLDAAMPTDAPISQSGQRVAAARDLVTAPPRPLRAPQQPHRAPRPRRFPVVHQALECGRDLVAARWARARHHSAAALTPAPHALPAAQHRGRSPDALGARPARARRAPGRRSSRGSRACPASVAGSPPCWPHGMPAPGNTADAMRCVARRETLEGSSHTYTA